MPIPICVVDAFASRPFEGNPAGVCLAPPGRPDSWKQAVARELNLSETAFPVSRDDGDWDLRWFTPAAEVDLCGHATLATAHALWARGLAPADAPIRFHTRGGVLECVLRDGLVSMDFPARPAEACTVPDGLDAALGAAVRFCGRSADDLLVEIPTEAEVRGCVPDLAFLGRIPARGIIVTAASATDEADFVSRFFAPAVGVPEDPVTGSAHCTLAVHWGRRLGRARMRGRQVGPRGGAVGVEWIGNRVRLAGTAVTVWNGELA